MSQAGFFSINRNVARRIIAFGLESNSGGIAPNGDATGDELTPRDSVQIWNNDSGGFETLDIGTNNLLDHFGLTDNTTHSWELGLANICDANGTIEYLVKFGQGGSVVSEWAPGGTYYTKLETRMDGAISELGVSNVVFWLTFGINDRIAGASTGTFKTGYQGIIANIKASYPGAKFILLKNMADNGNDVYNTVIQEIADADADVDTISASASVLGDGNHWTYTGQKENATEFYNKMIANNW